MGELPRGRSLLGVKTPDRSNEPPPWVGARYGDWSRYQQRNIHWGWDVWEVAGAPVTAPRPGTVIATKNRAQASPDYNVVVMLALRIPSRLHANKTVTVYAQYLHTHPAVHVGQKVERGQKIGEVGFFGMDVMGNPHSHVEFFWSSAACLAYDHPRAIDPYFVRRHYLNEESPLVLVPRRYAWWPERKFFPGTDRRIKPYEREPIRAAAALVPGVGEDPAAGEIGNESLVAPEYRDFEGEVTHACGTGDADPEKVAESLRENGIEPVYLDGGDLDLDTMIAEQEGVPLEAVTYGQNADDDEEKPEPVGLPREDE